MKQGIKFAFQFVLVIALVAVLLGSVLLPAIVLPFVDTIGVASAIDTVPVFDSVNLYRSYVQPGVYQLSGITFTVNNDFSILVNGTSTSSVAFMLGNTTGNPYTWGNSQSVNWSAGSYYLSFGNRTNYCYFQLVLIINGVQSWLQQNQVFTFTDDINFFNARIFVEANSTVDNMLFKPQFERGTEATPYQPNLNAIYDLGHKGFDDLQNQVTDLQNKNNQLQNQYDNLLSSLEWDFVRSLDLTSFSLSNNDVFGSSANLVYKDTTYYGYLFKSSDVSSNLSGISGTFNLRATIPQGNRVKISWDYFGPYDFSNTLISETLTVGVSSGIIGENTFIYNNSFMNGYLYRVNHTFEFVAPYDISYIEVFSSSKLSSGLFISGLKVYTNGLDVSIIADDYYNQGVKDGYDEGYRIGQEKGYADGQKSQGDYSFFGLIGAVIDAPINSFKQMFDFEVLGVNLSSFVLSLFTMSVIIVILKMVIGR